MSRYFHVKVAFSVETVDNAEAGTVLAATDSVAVVDGRRKER